MTLADEDVKSILVDNTGCDVIAEADNTDNLCRRIATGGLICDLNMQLSVLGGVELLIQDPGPMYRVVFFYWSALTNDQVSDYM